MKISTTRDILSAVRNGKLSISKADNLLKLDALSIVDKVARLDFNRHLRRGVPEIIYAKGKTPSQLSKIVARLLLESEARSITLPIIISKVSKSHITNLRKMMKSRARKKDATKDHILRHYRSANIVAFVPSYKIRDFQDKEKPRGRVALLSAGTSDIGILDEAQTILDLLGCATIRFDDVGVASLKRLISPLKQIQKFDPDAVVVAAGMEGALPSIIAGLSSVPVIGLPTSVGYGYGGRGESALMSMLQACPLGISAVNIDGGVSAGIVAWLIARRSSEFRECRGLESQRGKNLGYIIEEI